MIGVLLAGALLAPQNVPLTSITGNDLWEVCAKDTAQGSACTSYIAGALDALALMERLSGIEEPCVPQRATYAQVRDIVTAYIQANPGDRDIAAVVIVLVSTRQSFGCSMDFIPESEPENPFRLR